MAGDLKGTKRPKPDPPLPPSKAAGTRPGTELPSAPGRVHVIDESIILVPSSRLREFIEFAKSLEPWIKSLIGGRKKIADAGEIERLTGEVEAWAKQQPARPSIGDGVRYLQKLIGQRVPPTLRIKVVVPAIQAAWGKSATGPKRK